MAATQVSIPGAFWEYFKLTDVITGRDTSPAALDLAKACKVPARMHGKSFTVPVMLTADTMPVLAQYVDIALSCFKDVPNRRDSQLYRGARALRERLDTAQAVLDAAPESLFEPDYTPWGLQGPHARRGAAVAVSKAIRETTGLVPSPAENRGKYTNDLIVSGDCLGVTVHVATFDPKHYDTEATCQKILDGLGSKGYVLEFAGVKVDEERDMAWGFIQVRGRRQPVKRRK